MNVMPELEVELTRLDRLASRVCAIVRKIDSESEDIARLKTLGVCSGRQVELIKRGDPLILRVFSSRIGISSSLAERVWVEVCTPSHCAMKDHPCT
jgi:Fe2+ transport system protein FeoA